VIKILLVVIALIIPAFAVSFPVVPMGMCYDGCQKLMEENAYPGAKIAYNSQMSNGQGHVWLIQGDKIIDTYYGEMPNQTSGYQAEAIYDTWEEFDSSLPRINVMGL
jgi:hypothetical protein